MRTVAFTAESNSHFDIMACEVGRRFEELNGIPCRVITPKIFNFAKLRSPHWVKAFLWEFVTPEIERVIWLDMDVVLMRAMDPIPEVPFAAVHDDFGTLRNVKAVSERVRKLPKFFNTGFFAATRAAMPAFAEMQEAMWEDPGLAGSHGECACFNFSVHSKLGGWHELPPIYNWLTMNGYPDGNCIMVHYAGGSSEKHHVAATIKQLLQNERARLKS